MSWVLFWGVLDHLGTILDAKMSQEGAKMSPRASKMGVKRGKKWCPECPGGQNVNY